MLGCPRSDGLVTVDSGSFVPAMTADQGRRKGIGVLPLATM